MSRPASFDAIEFSHASKRHLRVYYQFDGEQAVRESCYYEGYGWFVRGEGVVTRQAKSGTRITATRWLDDRNNMKICVFYLDDANQICWSHTDQELITPWKSAIITENLPKIDIQPSSGLAVSLPENQNQPLRLFFQENDTGNIRPLRELRLNYINETWQLLKGRIVADALKGTRMSAASDNVTKALRLYYQNSDMALCEVACDRNYRWRPPSTIQKDLIPQAPISVVSWDSGQPVPDIRVYTVISATRRRILELSYTFPNWKSAIVPAPGYRNSSGMAACRNTGWDVNSHSPIHFFHQPGRRQIAMDLLPADDSPGSRMLVSKILPLATIPTAIDGPLDASHEGEDQKEEQAVKKLRKDLSDSKLEADQLRTANQDLITKLEAAQNNQSNRKKGDNAATGYQDPLSEFFARMDHIPEFLQPADMFHVIRSLYLDGFDINGKDTTGSGRTALIDSIKRHGKQTVTLLLSRDIDFQETDSTSDNPLNAACRYEEEGIVRALLEKGSNPNVKDKAGKTPLHEAACRNKKSIVLFLLDKGASVDSRDADGNTPLHLASSRDIMLLLLQRKADVNARNLRIETPLWHIKSVPEMQLLVENRANVNALDKNGWGRLHWAVINEEESIIQYLIGAGRADINLQLPDKPTPLHMAVSFNRESIVRLLLAAGADRNRQWEGRTPLHFAKRDGQQSLINLLQ